MNHVILKFKNDCFRIRFSDTVFEGISIIDPEEVKPYSPRSSLSKGQWYYIDSIKEKEYFDEILIGKDTVKYPMLDGQKISECKFILDHQDDCLCVQNISSYKIMKKRLMGSNGELLDSGSKLIINDEPDYIYDKKTDRLYFKSITAVSHFLPGIVAEYREATEEEVNDFVNKMDINLIGGFTQTDIKTRNRKLIGVIYQQISELSKDKKQQLFEYVKEYCPQYIVDSKMTVKSDKELNELLYALDERFYTTPVTGITRKALTVD